MKRGNQNKLAVAVGISPSYLSEIINNPDKTPSPEIAKKLAEATKTSPLLWLYGTPDQMKAALAGEPEPTKAA